jgi:hypothetical protein
MAAGLGRYERDTFLDLALVPRLDDQLQTVRGIVTGGISTEARPRHRVKFGRARISYLVVRIS